ncbi:hypothetical protein [Streptomyces montanus]|uniref:hypothetical protein n=1 Tax=Streptomyces montanus TaxID=2580423 RepID=UPI001BB26B3E|nr:hypothetical protein [Streptomyces montanus]
MTYEEIARVREVPSYRGQGYFPGLYWAATMLRHVGFESWLERDHANRHHGDMTNPNLTTGSIWRLHHGEQEIARLTVTGADMPWTHAEVETLSGFEEFRPLFAEHERAVDDEEWEQADACYTQIRSELTMTFPDGSPVAEFMLHIHDDGTAGWRWHDEPFDTVNQ